MFSFFSFIILSFSFIITNSVPKCHSSRDYPLTYYKSAGNVLSNRQERVFTLGDILGEINHHIVKVAHRSVIVEVSPRTERAVIINPPTNDITRRTLVDNEVGVSFRITETEIKVNVPAFVDTHCDEVRTLDQILCNRVQFFRGKIASCVHFLSLQHINYVKVSLWGVEHNGVKD